MNKIFHELRLFKDEMQEKLIYSANVKKRSGWDDPSWTIEDVKKQLLDHVEKDDPVDVANLAMFWRYKQKNK